MEAYFWYREQRLDTLQRDLERTLRAGGFAVLEDGAGGWARVRLGHKSVWWSVTQQIEAHHCAHLAVAQATFADLPTVLTVFLATIRDQHLPVREASLHLGIPPEIPWFTFEKFRNEKPPLLMMELEDGTWTATAPGEATYWERSKPELHFVAEAVLMEPGVAEPDAWAAAIGASLHQGPHGVLFDCGWTTWSEQQGIATPAVWG